MKRFINYLKNNGLSFFSLTGIKDFIIVDINVEIVTISQVKIKLPFYQVVNPDLIKNSSVVLNRKYYGIDSQTELNSKVSQFIKETGLEQFTMLVGIANYRLKTISVRKDIEDIDLWMLENLALFLPPGVSGETFRFTYEKLKTGEDSDTYVVVISRTDYISDIMKLGENEGIDLICVAPFQLSYHLTHKEENKKRLSIILCGTKLTWCFTSEDHPLLQNELYFNESQNGNSNISESELNDKIKDIWDSIRLETGSNNTDNLEIVLFCEKEFVNYLKQALKSIISANLLIFPNDEIDTSVQPGFYQLQKLYEGSGEVLNLIDETSMNTTREKLEKNITQRIVIAAGIILIGFLLGLYVLENSFNSSLGENEESILEIQSTMKLIENYNEENKLLRNNLQSLKQLKLGRLEYSTLLFSINSVVTDKSFFSGLEINDDRKNKLELNLDGISFNENELADLIKRLESADGFSDIRLVYANSIEKTELDIVSAAVPKMILNFRIIAVYVAD